MLSKFDFTPAEWRKLLEAPLLAGFANTGGDPTAFIKWFIDSPDARTEYNTEACIAAANAIDSGGELIKAVVKDLRTSRSRQNAREAMREVVQGGEPTEIKKRTIAELQSIAAIVDAKAPADAKAFKSWLLDIAYVVAENWMEGLILDDFDDVEVDGPVSIPEEISDALGE